MSRRRHVSLTLSILFSLCVAQGLAAPPNAGSASGASESPQEAKFLANMRQITDGFVKAGEGYFSPDGRQIVYQAVPRSYPFYQIYTQPLVRPGDASSRDTAPKRVSTGRGRTTCSYYSPDGEHILFASSHLDPDLTETERKAREQLEEDRRTGRRRRYSWVFDPHMDLFVTDRQGKFIAQLTDTRGYDAECAYSSDGKRIVFCSDRDGDPDLYVMNSDGSDLRQLTDAPGYDGGPFFSPDGKWVIYRSDRLREHHLQIHVIASDGSHDVTLTEGESVNWGPYWHPTEPYIIWAGADHSQPGVRPNYDLWLLRLDFAGTEVRPGKRWRVTSHPAADVLPVFSPDGQQLMWTSTRTEDGSSQLWIADFKLPATEN